MAASGVIFGIDLLPGFSAQSRTKQPHYALVVLRGEELVEEYEDVSFTRLIRLAWEYKPDVVAVDNVFELARDAEELVELANILPPNTRIVQITGWGSEAEDLATIARRYGCEISGKPSPLKTARACALISSRGGGVVVKPSEERTKIVVTRSRSASQGGSSTERFRRSIRASILNVTREVKRVLDERGLDYDLVFRKSQGGLERSTFIVYAPREKLYGLIRPFKNKNVRLIMRPMYRGKIVFEGKGAERSTRGVILGVDPGASIGVAAIDLHGNPLHLRSYKGVDREEIVSEVSKLGEVLIVATDTSQAPELVKKLSALLNAKVFTPPSDLSSEEKQEIVSRVLERFDGLRIDDSHVRDALSSAYKALYSIRDKIEHVESRVREMNIDLDVERIKIEVIRGASFAEALEKELERHVEKLKSAAPPSRAAERKSYSELEGRYLERIKKLKSRIAYLELTVRELTNQLRERDRVISDLRVEMKTTGGSTSEADACRRRVYVLESEIESLRRELQRRDELASELSKRVAELEDLVLKISSGSHLLVPRASSLSAKEVKRIASATSSSLLYVDEVRALDREAIEHLRSRKMAIITSKDCGDLYRELMVPVVKAEGRGEFKDYVVVERGVLDRVSEQWKAIEELELRDKYKRVWKVVKEYKEARSRNRSQN